FGALRPRLTRRVPALLHTDTRHAGLLRGRPAHRRLRWIRRDERTRPDGGPPSAAPPNALIPGPLFFPGTAGLRRDHSSTVIVVPGSTGVVPPACSSALTEPRFGSKLTGIRRSVTWRCHVVLVPQPSPALAYGRTG